ncbi:PHP domain-containing protein, partial [Halalkalibacter flavus]
IKPILGLTITIQGLATSQHYPMVLLVENQTGYHNLLAISSLLKTTSEAVTFDMLTAYLAGLYIVLPSVGELPVILGAEPERAMDMVQSISAVT